MSKINALENLEPIANEMLAGLHADDDMKRRIRLAADAPKVRKTPVRAFAPAVCCAAAALLCVGLVFSRPDAVSVTHAVRTTDAPDAVQISTIAAGDGGALSGGTAMAALVPGAMVRASVNTSDDSLFEDGTGDIPLVAVDGGVYRMLKYPEAVDSAMLGEAVGSIAGVTDQPSLAGDDALAAGLSNVAAEGAQVYAVSGLSSKTAVAAEVNGAMRLFQRVSYAGRGPGGQGIEDTLDVRGKVEALELSGVGAVTGEKANGVMDALLDNAVLVQADAAMGSQKLVITLQSGVQLELGVSGDMLTGCGGWSCPEFFDAFEAAM